MNFFKTYGAPGVVVYLTIYVLTVAGFFAAVSSGLLTAETVKSWITALHLEKHVDTNLLNRVDSATGRFIIAWIATKIVEPLRLFVAVSITPSVLRLYKSLKGPP